MNQELEQDLDKVKNPPSAHGELELKEKEDLSNREVEQIQEEVVEPSSSQSTGKSTFKKLVSGVKNPFVQVQKRMGEFRSPTSKQMVNFAPQLVTINR